MSLMSLARLSGLSEYAISFRMQSPGRVDTANFRSSSIITVLADS